MFGVAVATANIFFVKTAQDWQIRQDLECKVIMFVLYVVSVRGYCRHLPTPKTFLVLFLF